MSRAMTLGAECVRLLNEQGLPVAFSFARLAERGLRPALLGCLVECLRRGLGRAAARNVAGEFLTFFEPTAAEAAAAAHLGAVAWPTEETP